MRFIRRLNWHGLAIRSYYRPDVLRLACSRTNSSAATNSASWCSRSRGGAWVPAASQGPVVQVPRLYSASRDDRMTFRLNYDFRLVAIVSILLGIGLPMVFSA